MTKKINLERRILVGGFPDLHPQDIKDNYGYKAPVDTEEKKDEKKF